MKTTRLLFSSILVICLLSLLGVSDFKNMNVKANKTPNCIDCYDDGFGVACWSSFYNGYKICWTSLADGTCMCTVSCGEQ